MSASKITYADKDDSLPVTDERRKFFDLNANEIKTVVNQHAEEIDSNNHDRGTFDASLGLPSTGGSGTDGARLRFDRFINTTGAEISGVYVDAGVMVMALRDDPTNDWDKTTGYRTI